MLERVGRSKATNAPLFAVKTAPTRQAFHRNRGSGWGRLVSTANRHGSTASALFGRPQPVEAGLSRQSAANHREPLSHERPFSRSRPLLQVGHSTGTVGAVSTANGHGRLAGALWAGLAGETGLSAQNAANHQQHRSHERPFSRSRPLLQVGHSTLWERSRPRMGTAPRLARRSAVPSGWDSVCDSCARPPSGGRAHEGGQVSLRAWPCCVPRPCRRWWRAGRRP